jgi:anti-sigma factor RsiW
MDKPAESCQEVLALLSDYLDLELPPDACQQIENHLTGCSPCEEFAASLRETVKLCRKFQPSDMPKPLSERARAELEAAWKKMLAERQPG